MTFTTTSTPSTSTSAVRGKNTWSAWNAIANFSSQITNVSSRTELFKYLDTDLSDFSTDIEKENFDILTW